MRYIINEVVKNNQNKTFGSLGSDMVKTLTNSSIPSSMEIGNDSYEKDKKVALVFITMLKELFGDASNAAAAPQPDTAAPSQDVATPQPDVAAQQSDAAAQQTDIGDPQTDTVTSDQPDIAALQPSTADQ